VLAEDALAQYVAGVREMAGEEGASTSTVQVDDWESGPRTVEMYGEILGKFPVKAASNRCQSCDGRGVIVCDNCQGSGIQPRFLVRPRTRSRSPTLRPVWARRVRGRSSPVVSLATWQERYSPDDFMD